MHRAADTVSASIKGRDSYESPAHPLGGPLRTVSVKKDDGNNNRERRISSDTMDQSFQSATKLLDRKQGYRRLHQ